MTHPPPRVALIDPGGHALGVIANQPGIACVRDLGEAARVILDAGGAHGR